MGLTGIIVMHEPIKDSGGDPFLLGVDCRDDGQWISTDYGEPGCSWNRVGGFAVCCVAN